MAAKRASVLAVAAISGTLMGAARAEGQVVAPPSAVGSSIDLSRGHARDNAHYPEWLRQLDTELLARKERVNALLEVFYRARAAYQASQEAYLAAMKQRRQGFENSESVVAMTRRVDDWTKAVTAARKEAKARMIADPVYGELSRKEAAAQRIVRSLREEGAPAEVIFAASSEVLRIGGLVSAMEREWERNDETLHEEMVNLAAASAALANAKHAFEKKFEADAELKSLRKIRDDDYAEALATRDDVMMAEWGRTGPPRNALPGWKPNVVWIPPGISPGDERAKEIPLPAGLPSTIPVGGGGMTPVGGNSMTPVGMPMTGTGGGGMTPTGGAGMTPTGGARMTPVGGMGMTPVGGAGMTPVGGGSMTPGGK